MEHQIVEVNEWNMAVAKREFQIEIEKLEKKGWKISGDFVCVAVPPSEQGMLSKIIFLQRMVRE